jgi:hypothetical protein
LKSVWKTTQSPTPALAPPKRNWPIEVHQSPHFMREHLAYVIDVVGDGHYRFHVVFGLLGKCVDDHHIVHLELTIELNKKRARYL